MPRWRNRSKKKNWMTLPERSVNVGRLHPSTQQLRRVLDILAEMGFQVYTSREVETDDINFQMLNFPPDHPARDMQDTFFIEPSEGDVRVRFVSIRSEAMRVVGDP